MANMVPTKVQLTERQSSWLRAEAHRRDVSEGEVLRGLLDFCMDLAKGQAAISAATGYAHPLARKTA